MLFKFILCLVFKKKKAFKTVMTVTVVKTCFLDLGVENLRIHQLSVLNSIYCDMICHILESLTFDLVGTRWLTLIDKLFTMTAIKQVQ